MNEPDSSNHCPAPLEIVADFVRRYIRPEKQERNLGFVLSPKRMWSFTIEFHHPPDIFEPAATHTLEACTQPRGWLVDALCAKGRPTRVFFLQSGSNPPSTRGDGSMIYETTISDPSLIDLEKRHGTLVIAYPSMSAVLISDEHVFLFG